MPDPRVKFVRRGNCADTDTCPAAAVLDPPDGDVYAVGPQVTDPALLAQLRVGPGEMAVRLPGHLLPEVLADAARH